MNLAKIEEKGLCQFYISIRKSSSVKNSFLNWYQMPKSEFQDQKAQENYFFQFGFDQNPSLKGMQ